MRACLMKTSRNQRNTIIVPIFTRRDQIDVEFPAKWVICPACEGNATTTRHIECDGGGFTGEEWAEACNDDEDFAEKYFGGFYDRPCPDCDGKGRVQIIDEDKVEDDWRMAIFLRAYHAQLREDAEYRAMEAAERRIGA